MHSLNAVVLIIVFFILLVITGIHLGYATTNINDLIFSKDSSPYGIPFAEWQGKWWQWNIGLIDENDQNPKNTNSPPWHPRDAFSSEKCAWNQYDENVWMLPDGKNMGIIDYSLGKQEERTCTVPQDRAILLQVYGGGCDFSEGWTTDEELKTCVSKGLDKVPLNVKVDGIEVMNSEGANMTKFMEEFLPNLYIYNITYPENNQFLEAPGTYRAMAQGYYLFLKPLSVGTHTIEFRTAYLEPGNLGEDSDENRFQNVHYTIKVV